jgi:transketolase
MYVCIEKYYGIDAEMLFTKHGGHPHRDEGNKIHCSTGSLGLGLPIALGRALANRNRKVWVLISDGEAAEGSIWESLKTIQELGIDNIEVFVNINGLCAYKEVDVDYMTTRLKAFLPNIQLRYTTVEQYPFLKGLNAHYHVMTEENYKQATEL